MIGARGRDRPAAAAELADPGHDRGVGERQDLIELLAIVGGVGRVDPRPARPAPRRPRDRRRRGRTRRGRARGAWPARGRRPARPARRIAAVQIGEAEHQGGGAIEAAVADRPIEALDHHRR
jgi:hypothetical protein